jgi:hypothetical protein
MIAPCELALALRTQDAMRPMVIPRQAQQRSMRGARHPAAPAFLIGSGFIKSDKEQEIVSGS